MRSSLPPPLKSMKETRSSRMEISLRRPSMRASLRQKSWRIFPTPGLSGGPMLVLPPSSLSWLAFSPQSALQSWSCWHCGDGDDMPVRRLPRPPPPTPTPPGTLRRPASPPSVIWSQHTLRNSRPMSPPQTSTTPRLSSRWTATRPSSGRTRSFWMFRLARDQTYSNVFLCPPQCTPRQWRELWRWRILSWHSAPAAAADTEED